MGRLDLPRSQARVTGASASLVSADADLKAKVDFALKLIADEGLIHGDEGARNVLLRPDGRICLIDWGEAQLK